MNSKILQKYPKNKVMFTYLVMFLPVIAFPAIHYFHSSSFHFTLTTNILVLLFLAPCLEELTFRGLAQELILYKTKNYIFTILIVNLAFVALHYNVNKNIIYLSVVFICGIIFSTTKILYERVRYPIMLHMYYNGCFILYIKFIK